jgi:O-methyltransferase
MDGSNAINYILENNIEGVLVECGVLAGDMQKLWITELQKKNNVRDIYLYDTFEGMVQPGEHDYTGGTAILYYMNNEMVHESWKNQIISENTNGWCYCPLEYVKEKLNSTGYPQDKLNYIVGDVMETLKNASNIPEKIAILRLDTDWYESSKYELEQMYDNVVTGGLIIFDDYYHWNGQKKATDEFFQSRGIKPYLMNLQDGKTAAMIKL